jgi:pimeloyl-ACP methyl ester carboxylesterase
VANFGTSTGRVYYPTNADAPFAGVALCGGFLNSGPEMNSWGEFYASYGIVTIITNTGALDFPDVRGRKLLASINTLKQENTRAGSPLNGKMAGRYGTSGYSMGGGGTTLATRSDRSLKSSVGLAAWAPNGSNVQTPTLFLCGSADVVAPCNGSRNAYNAIPNATPKMLVTAPLAGHLDWFGPSNAGGGLSGRMALAWQKVHLEGDQRWTNLLKNGPSITVTNIR